MKSTNTQSSFGSSCSVSSSSIPESADLCSNGSKDDSVPAILSLKGYKSLQSISDALQGSVWTSTFDDERVVIKMVDKRLHKKGITYSKHGKRLKVSENIIKEAGILKYLTESSNPPASLTKFVDFFEDDHHFYLVMEHGGDSLFSFVKQCHVFIEAGLLPLSVWRSFCKSAMLQMIELMDWMHRTMRCCHLDISLENFVIQNINVILNQKSNKVQRFDRDFQIKIIDFGVSEVFGRTNIDFECNKWVGKTGYKCPEVYAKNVFDARSADCWSLGVCFFMMMVGCCPYTMPCSSDVCYKAIMNGKLDNTLRSWKRVEYLTPIAMDFMSKIFAPKTDRFNIRQMQKHPYLVSHTM